MPITARPLCISCLAGGGACPASGGAGQLVVEPEVLARAEEAEALAWPVVAVLDRPVVVLVWVAGSMPPPAFTCPPTTSEDQPVAVLCGMAAALARMVAETAKPLAHQCHRPGQRSG
ncbi:UNVERIFIED_CONTAM: hypothetical protein K2H54_050000 [Gekko kuhli]